MKDFLIIDDEVIHAEVSGSVSKFQELVCEDCMNEHKGSCVKESERCPVEWLVTSYRKGG